MNPVTQRQYAIPVLCLVAGMALAGPAVSPRTPEAALPAGPAPAVRARFGHLPLNFEQNIGQTSPEVQWLARSPGSTLFIAGNEATVQLNHTETVRENGVEEVRARTASVRMTLLNALPARAATGEYRQSGTVNYLTGKDSRHWQQDVPIYGQVRLTEVYPGVSLLYHGERGQLEYDFVVAPNANPGRIALGFQGARPGIAANGDLLLPIPGDSTVRFDRPVAYQLDHGRRRPVASSYRLAANGRVSFRLGTYDHQRELIIDPTLVFLGTLGAGNYPYATNTSQITVDAAGAIYFIGTTNDPTFPVTPGAYQRVCGPATGNNAANGGVYCGTYGATSAFVTKISADGTTLVYSTYLSGHSGYEQGTSIAVDAAGVAYLLGATASSDFPVTADAFQSQCQPFGTPPNPVVSQCDNYANGGGTEYTVNGPEFFFAKLSADGSTLLYASFLGGSAAAYPVATALDASGNWYLYGQTTVFDANDLRSGNGGNIQFPGVSASGYQTISAAKSYNSQSATDIANAAVLSKFSNDGRTLLYGTFLADQTYGYNVFPSSLALGANGIAFLGGDTPAARFPTTPGAVKAACTALASGATYSCTSEDAFVTAIDTTKSGAASLVYSTRLGGSAPNGYSPGSGGNVPNQQAYGLAADAQNDVYVTGVTLDPTFPVPSNGYQNTCNTFNASNDLNCSTAFVVELNPTGTAILAGSFLQGPPAYYESSAGYKVLVGRQNLVYLYGTSGDGYGTFPLVNPVQGYSNNNEIYVATMSADLTRLLFSTRIGNPSLNGGNAAPINGLALGPADNIFFAATTQDSSFAATAGTYTTAVNSGNENHTFFGKIASPVSTVTYANGQCEISSVSAGNVTYSDIIVTVAGLVSGPTATAPVGSGVRYDGTTRQLTIPQVSVGGTTYDNVVVTVGDLVSIGSVTGTDTYSGGKLTIPAVQVIGGSLYRNIVVTVAAIKGVGGGIPRALIDQYDPQTHELLIPAIEFGGKVYTNVTVTVGAAG